MKSFYSLIFLCFAFTSCEDVIDVDLPSTKPILIIDANINLFDSDSSSLEGGVRLSLSADFFEQQVPVVENASVTLTNLNSGEEHPIPYSGTDGWYQPMNSDIFLDRDASYELLVNYNNQKYRAQTTIYSVSPIDSIQQGTRTLFQGDEIEVEISFSDNSNLDNFYLYDLGFDEFQPIRDQFFQGSSFTFSNFYDTEDLSVGDTLLIKGYGISKQYYNYMELLLQQVGGDGGPFGSVAATARGNIVNSSNPKQFPLGYFIISEGVKEAIVIRDLNTNSSK